MPAAIQPNKHPEKASRTNESGDTLSDGDWLDTHHQAKLPERKEFAEYIATLAPRRIVDLGCATGLWLSLLNDCLPTECEFIGLDQDRQSLDRAIERAESWERPTRFEQVNLDDDPSGIPDADLILIFNILPYIKDPQGLLRKLAQRRKARVLIRQWDGDTDRFGPMKLSDRRAIDRATHRRLDTDTTFRNYFMDPVFEAIAASGFAKSSISFEKFSRVSPYTKAFRTYLHNTIEWQISFLEPAEEKKYNRIRAGLGKNFEKKRSYYTQTDLVALLQTY